MAENVRPPVAIRIVRPFETEDELLDNELETIGKTSVLLIGAHPRPTGVILRFEVTLASGATVLRGEGRVLAHKENAFRGQAGLTLRFTRLDPKSKAVVDRATAIRETRAALGQGDPNAAGKPTSASRPPPSLRPDPALTGALTQDTPPPPPVEPFPPAKSDPDLQAAARAADAKTGAGAGPVNRANRPSNRPTRQFAAVRPDLTPPPLPVAPAPPVTAVSAGPTPPPPPMTPPYMPEVLSSSALIAAPESEPDLASALTPVTSIPGEVAPVSLAEEAMAEAHEAHEKRTVAPSQTAPTLAVPSQRASKRSSRRANDVAGAAPSSTRAPLERPENRDDLLGRLRERGKTLSPERVAEILARG